MTETQLQTVPLGSTDMSISRVGFGARATDQHQHHVQYRIHRLRRRGCRWRASGRMSTGARSRRNRPRPRPEHPDPHMATPDPGHPEVLVGAWHIGKMDRRASDGSTDEAGGGYR
jgi:hypothetical protein